MNDCKQALTMTQRSEHRASILQEILRTLQGSKIAEPSGKDKQSRFWAKYKKVLKNMTMSS